MLHNEFPEGITDRSKATLRDTVRCIPSIFQSYSNWQLHSNVDIHLPLSNTSTQPNYTSLDNNHSASSVSQQGNLTSHACSNYLLEATKQRSNLLNQQQLAVFIGCFFFNSLTCLSSNTSTSQQWEVISNIKLLYIYLFQLENKISNPADLPTHRWYAAGNPVRWCPARVMSDKTERIFRVWVDVGQITLRRKIGWR